jgi:hypothetical protein
MRGENSETLTINKTPNIMHCPKLAQTAPDEATTPNLNLKLHLLNSNKQTKG